MNYNRKTNDDVTEEHVRFFNGFILKTGHLNKIVIINLKFIA